MMNLHSSREREPLRGKLVRIHAAICLFCQDYCTVSANSKTEAQAALRGAHWHTMGSDWVCPGCYGRQQGYRELERREKRQG